MQTKQFGSIWVDTENHGQVKIGKRYGVIKGRFFLPINTCNFTYPSWLSPSFPIHEWCDKYDTSTLATLDIRALRAAHYIEWFTRRDFYDGRQSPLNNSKNDILKTGLYFAGDRPIVIYPKQTEQVENKL